MDETGLINVLPDLELIRQGMYAISISDEETKTTLKEAYEKHQLLLEPHGSVGWAGLMSYLKEHNNDDTPDQVCVCLETAHPAKFPQEIQELLGIDPDLPPSLEGLEKKEEAFVTMSNNYEEFKGYLKENS